MEEKDQRINESINYKAVCRTAPATPGLLIIDKAEIWQLLIFEGAFYLTDPTLQMPKTKRWRGTKIFGMIKYFLRVASLWPLTFEMKVVNQRSVFTCDSASCNGHELFLAEPGFCHNSLRKQDRFLVRQYC